MPKMSLLRRIRLAHLAAMPSQAARRAYIAASLDLGLYAAGEAAWYRAVLDLRP